MPPKAKIKGLKRPPELDLPRPQCALVQHLRNVHSSWMAAVRGGWYERAHSLHERYEALDALSRTLEVDGDVRLMRVMEQVRIEHARRLLEIHIEMGKR